MNERTNFRTVFFFLGIQKPKIFATNFSSDFSSFFRFLFLLLFYFLKFCSMEKQRSKDGRQESFFYFIFCQAGTENVLVFKQFHLFIYGISVCFCCWNVCVCVCQCVLVYLTLWFSLFSFLVFFKL